MPLEVYLAYLATVAVFFASPPGPSQLLMITNSLRYGVRPSMSTVAGDLTANMLQMIAAGFGLATLIAAFPTSLTVIKWLGVAYLAWIGLRLFRASSSTFTPAPGEAGRRDDPFQQGPFRPRLLRPGLFRPGLFRPGLFRQGFITSATNPTAIFFFAALFPQFIDPATAIWPQLVILGLTYIAIDGLLLTVWGATAQGLLSRFGGRSPQWLNRLSGSLIIAAAVLLALKDVTLPPSRT
ncbi:LysE family translocator [Pelagibius sp.]|uniref:LysE family translocator n=1 Tax=Pelagibius sp. TaxID=1931238 RepID=UPI003B507F96